jgi:hypothetical protein
MEFKNLAQIQTAFRAAPIQMAAETQKVIVESGRLVQQTAKEFIKSRYSRPPYDTGRMYGQTLVFFPRPLYAEIKPMVDYAIYPHEGLSTSRRYGPRRFIKDALDNDLKEIEDKFQKACQNVFDTIGRKV